MVLVQGYLPVLMSQEGVPTQRNSQLASGILGYLDIRPKIKHFFFVGPLATSSDSYDGPISWNSFLG